MPLVTLPDYDYYDLVNLDHEFAQVLVSWWKVMPGWYGGTVWYDLMKRNNATLTNVAIPYSSTSGMVLGSTLPGAEGEMRFNGSNMYGNIGVLPQTVGASVVVVRFAGRTTNATTRMTPFGMFNGSAASGWLFDYNRGATNPSGQRFFCFLRTGSGATLQGYTTNTTNGMDGNWHWLEIVWDLSNQTITFTLDDVLQGITYTSQTVGSTVVAFARDLYLGAQNELGTPILYFSPAIGEVSIAVQKTPSWYQSALLGHPSLLRRRVYRYISIPSGVVPTPKRIIGGGLLPMVV